VQQLYSLLGAIIYGVEEEDTLEILIGKSLTEKVKTLAVAESCTGGKLAAQLTAIPGASAYFKGGIISYATSAKTSVLNIPKPLIEKHTVVSAEVAEAMAKSAQRLFNADFAVATTGNAGPAKGDADAEIGTVFIAIATPVSVFSEKFSFGNHRENVVTKAVNKALELLQKEIVKN
jgi:nicotinamide-nucleotide amidase